MKLGQKKRRENVKEQGISINVLNFMDDNGNLKSLLAEEIKDMYQQMTSNILLPKSKNGIKLV